jgi:pterin-4a-carbinolamine dehydratase
MHNYYYYKLNVILRHMSNDQQQCAVYVIAIIYHHPIICHHYKTCLLSFWTHTGSLWPTIDVSMKIRHRHVMYEKHA